MSDVEIIEAVRLSALSLFTSPIGLLSLIAHYSRPNVFIFTKTKEMEVVTTHYTVENSTVTRSHGLAPGELDYVYYLAGAIGDDIYFGGHSSRYLWALSSFSMRTHTFTYRCSTTPVSIISKKYVYACGEYSRRDKRVRFRRCNPITGKNRKLPDMIVARGEKDGYGYCSYKGNIYIFGGFDKNGDKISSCERFDIKENKWYNIAPMPFPAAHIHVIAKDDGLILVTIEGSVFMYNPVKNEWTTLLWDEAFIKLDLKTLQYSRGRFIAVSDADLITTIWESTSPEKPWNPILKLPSNLYSHIYLTEE